MKTKTSILALTKAFFILLVICCLFSCTPTPKETIWSKTEDFIIVKINPPKHFYLDLKRVGDGKIFTEVYISKHCNDMCISVGDRITATYGKYKRGEYIWEEFDNYKIHDMVCNCK
jgi:hypothetical protein